MPNDHYKFHGFISPNTTQVPDALFDELLNQLSGAELKVVLYIIRRTFGFKKEADNISLNQICKGIATKDGRVLDHGTGLSQSTVLTAVKGLLEKGVIVATRRSSPERGNEPTNYALNLAHPFTENRGRGGPKIEEGVPRKSGTQQTVLQETERQQHGGVVDELTEFGITRGVAQRLAASHDREYIRQKLDWVHDLQERSPNSVGKNPAGFLARAIEEDYQPDPGYKSPQQREAAAAQRARAQQLQLEQEQAEAREREREREAARQALSQDHPPRPIEGTDLTTATAWLMALERLKQTMSGPNYTTWLAETVLIRCDRSKALVAAPSGFAADWLRSRFSVLICKELAAIVGFRPAQLDCLPVSELVQPTPDGAPGADSVPPTPSSP
jgi:hypothetical protein